MEKKDVINLSIDSDKKTIGYFKENEKFIKERTNAKKISFSVGKSSNSGIVFTIKGIQIAVDFS